MTWEDAWREGRTGWDAGCASPTLRRLVAEGSVAPGRALVPGCGAGYDVFALAADDRVAVGLDLAPTAGERFAALREQQSLSADHAQIVIGDFFGYLPEARFDVIFDYTFLCAIEPDQRQAWAEKMDALLADGGELITLIFPVTDVPMRPGGPPYCMSPELVRELLEPRFAHHVLEPVTESNPGREGKEWLGRWRRR